MNILRLSTLALGLAIVVITLGYVNPSLAVPPECETDSQLGRCRPAPGDVPTGTVFTASLEGAFEFGPMEFTVAAQGDHLIPAEDVKFTRPGNGAACSTISDVDDKAACLTWGRVFDVCRLFELQPGQDDPVGPDSFIAPAGKQGWQIVKPGGVRVAFPFPFRSAFLNADLDVSLQLKGDCAYSGGSTLGCDPFLPEAGKTSRIPLIGYGIRASGGKGAANRAECQQGGGPLDAPVSTLVITAPSP